MNFGLSRKLFTIIALDLVGYGKSDSEERDLSYHALERDAKICSKLMAELNHKTYSVCGWDEGARVAAILAIENQSRVNSLILLGFTPMMDEESSKAIGKTRDTSAWDKDILALYSDSYGEQRFSSLWRKYVDYTISNLESSDQFDIRDKLHKIKCPTLICYGTRDPIVNYSKHVLPVQENIYDSEIAEFKDAAHNIHQARATEFNEMLTKFVLSV